MDSLPLEVQLTVVSYLPHIDFFNYCCALEQCKKSSRAYTSERIRLIARRAEKLSISLHDYARDSTISRASRAQLEEELYDFYLTLLTTRGLEAYFLNRRVSIMTEENMFENKLPAPLFLTWHQAIFSNRRAARQMRLTHTHGIRNCGVCTASRAICRLSSQSPWQAGGWPVVRNNGDGTATYVDTIHSTSLSPMDILRYPGDFDPASYYILWPFGSAIASLQVLRLNIILHSSDRRHVDDIAYSYAEIITQ